MIDTFFSLVPIIYISGLLALCFSWWRDKNYRIRLPFFVFFLGLISLALVGLSFFRDYIEEFSDFSTHIFVLFMGLIYWRSVKDYVFLGLLISGSIGVLESIYKLLLEQNLGLSAEGLLISNGITTILVMSANVIGLWMIFEGIKRGFLSSGKKH